MRFKSTPKLNERQLLIAGNRYLLIDEDHKPIETVKEFFIRISKFVASIETKYKTSRKEINELEDKFYEMQANFEFLCGTTLGDRNRKKLMAECYVLPLHDNLESIYGTLYKSVQLHRLGAGIGYDFSEIRPEGSKVHSTGKESSGPISFMRLYDFSSEIIMNRGSVRHAGHMGILRIDHPDIEKFICAKEDYSQLTNFNLSIAVTDNFMKAYEKDKEFDLINPETGKRSGSLNARELMYRIADSVHKSAEPGIIFIDEINRHNTLLKVQKITATNLCGEQPLLPYEACYLGGIVLDRFYLKSNSSNYKKKIKWDRIEEVTRLSVRYLDNVIDLGYHVLPQIEKINVYDNRKIGLGIIGWADLLAKLELPYDSKKSLKLAEDIMKLIQTSARDESYKLGKIRGNFGNFAKSTFKQQGYKYMRNATVTTIAPSGTRSLFADSNGGIEPFFALAYIRKNMETLGNRTIYYINKCLEEKLKEKWLYSKEMMEKISKYGSIRKIDDIPDSLKRIFKTSNEIEPIWHLKMQSAFQKYTDNAVSKTINVAEKTTVKQIEKIYHEAYKLKLKGVTVYRNNSRDKQVLNI